MPKRFDLPGARRLANYPELIATLTAHIKQKATTAGGSLRILEAGCGREWPIKLEDLPYTLTGVDLDRTALDLRKDGRRDLDTAIHGDLRTVSLESHSYDVIYNSNVLEHIDGAEGVLTNFVDWLKPGGILILRFPNRDSVAGFLTRATPFWVHVLYKKYLQGMRSAGQPGHDPYPTFFDAVVSRKGMRAFCERHGLIIIAEYRLDTPPINSMRLWKAITLLMWAMHFASFRTLSVDHRGLVYIIEKPT